MLETEHGIFLDNENTGQTAQEVYEAWLATKKLPPKPSKTEILEQELANTNALVLELLEMIVGGV